jgi:hypothetical protein
MSFSYARRDYSSFVPWRRGPYLDGQMKGSTVTPDQLYALELAARRERSRELARLLVVAARAAKVALVRAAGAFSSKRLRHA